MEHIINYELDFDNINNLAAQFCEIDFNVVFCFNQNVFAYPSGITMLSSIMNFKRAYIDVEYDQKYTRYLSRTDFFKNLDYNVEEDFKRHNTKTNMLACTKILSDDDPDLIDRGLKNILDSHIKGKRDLVYGILLTTYEITDNILEHSSNSQFKQSGRIILNPGFVSAQYYPKEDIIEVGISDSGAGIVNTMASAYPDLSRSDVLLEAFKLNRTRHIKTMPTRGNGLAKLKEFVLSSEGSIRCRTNEFTIVFNKNYPEGTVEEVQPVIGTHFEIIIGCSNDIDIKPIFNACFEDYEDSEEDTLNDFFD